MVDIKTAPEGLILKVYVQPKSSRNLISGLHGDALKVKITSAPVAGAANKTCLLFIAKQLGVAKSRLRIISGQTSRTKRILIESDSEDRPAIEKIIRSLISLSTPV